MQTAALQPPHRTEVCTPGCLCLEGGPRGWAGGVPHRPWEWAGALSKGAWSLSAGFQACPLGWASSGPVGLCESLVMDQSCFLSVGLALGVFLGPERSQRVNM